MLSLTKTLLKTLDPTSICILKGSYTNYLLEYPLQITGTHLDLSAKFRERWNMLRLRFNVATGCKYFVSSGIARCTALWLTALARTKALILSFFWRLEKRNLASDRFATGASWSTVNSRRVYTVENLAIKTGVSF